MVIECEIDLEIEPCRCNKLKLEKLLWELVKVASDEHVWGQRGNPKGVKSM